MNDDTIRLIWPICEILSHKLHHCVHYTNYYHCKHHFQPRWPISASYLFLSRILQCRLLQMFIKCLCKPRLAVTHMIPLHSVHQVLSFKPVRPFCKQWFNQVSLLEYIIYLWVGLHFLLCRSSQLCRKCLCKPTLIVTQIVPLCSIYQWSIHILSSWTPC